MTRLERGGSELSECQIRFSVSFAIFSQIDMKVGKFQKKIYGGMKFFSTILWGYEIFLDHFMGV